MKIKELPDGHSDIDPSGNDVLLGDHLALVIGDTFITPADSPAEQWAEIAKILRVHGLCIRENQDER